LTVEAFDEPLEETPRKTAKTRKDQELLQGVQRIVVGNIEDRLNVFSELWELTNRPSCLATRIMSLSESFQWELQSDQDFSKNYVETFIRNLTGMKENRRQKENLPSNKRLKIIQDGWDSCINILQQLIDNCNVSLEKGVVFYLSLLML
jgi:hypothetical protein